MIAHLRGLLLEKSSGRAVVECGGVGYEAAISIPTFTGLPETGATVVLHIYTHVREDQLALFGFAEKSEKRLFEKLLAISGVGPKLALTILSGLEPERLIAAIRSNDHAMLTRIPGVGKKTAERVTLELKDKLEDLAAGAPVMRASVGGAVGNDVLSALVNLGYPPAAAEKAIIKVMEGNAQAGSKDTGALDVEALDFETLFRAAMGAVR